MTSTSSPDTPRGCGRRSTRNGVPAKIWWNQGGHGDRANGAARQAVWRDTLNRFWSHYLFGVENGAMTGAESDDRAREQHLGRVRGLAGAWRRPRSSLSPAAAAEANAIGQLERRSTSRRRRHAGAGRRRRVDRRDRARRGTAVAAPARLSERAADRAGPRQRHPRRSRCGSRSTSRRPIVSAMLVDYKAAGAPVIVTRGWADPQNRDSISQHDASRARHAVHDRLRAPAARLRLSGGIARRLGGAVERSAVHAAPPAGTRLTVTTALSSLRLPIVGGAKAWSAASAMTPAR